jgi:hypothetical protein
MPDTGSQSGIETKTGNVHNSGYESIVASWPINPFCEHGVWLGDANSNNPCAKCSAHGEGE